MSGVSTTSGPLRLGSRGTALVPSALSRRLAAEPPHEARRAFQLARSRFLASDRIDMGQLAVELGVDRTSLFRWVGNRDALLSEVLWSLAAPTLDHADAETTASGPDRVVTLLSSFVSLMIDAPYFREFLRREPSRALRLLTTKDSAIQRRYIAVTRSLLEEEVAAGRLASPLPLDDLAYVLVRLSESFTYADLITGEEPSGARAAAAFSFVLGPTRTEQLT
ncbi:QsdR family transcriptional regulator [Modestobacter muralis]|uniref:QsdR family transcriptional regulator n=1 Tax=Modestobacter muralis TaxID=1608614 RepID=UPI0030B89A46